MTWATVLPLQPDACAGGHTVRACKAVAMFMNNFLDKIIDLSALSWQDNSQGSCQI